MSILSPRWWCILSLPRIVTATVLLLVGSCAPTLPPPPPTAGDPAQSDTYRIGPLDNLDVFVWGADNLSAKIPVRPDGKISVPLAPDIQAVGRTPSEVAGAIEEALRPYVQNPLVTVIVAGFGDTAGQTIRVVGEVQRPAAVPYRAGMTVLDVMVAAGGLGPYAAGNRSVLVRGQGAEIYGLRLGDLINGGDIATNAPVLPGDVIMIPQTAF
jgi:polysaccharide export outer membrane protein